MIAGISSYALGLVFFGIITLNLPLIFIGTVIGIISYMWNAIKTERVRIRRNRELNTFFGIRDG